jgi:hypothetical protein
MIQVQSSRHQAFVDQPGLCHRLPGQPGDGAISPALAAMRGRHRCPPEGLFAQAQQSPQPEAMWPKQVLPWPSPACAC